MFSTKGCDVFSWGFPHMLYSFPSHANIRVAKLNFRCTFIYFHIYIYIYIYISLLCLESLSPSLRITWHIHTFWAKPELRITGIITYHWGFHHPICGCPDINIGSVTHSLIWGWLCRHFWVRGWTGVAEKAPLIRLAPQLPWREGYGNWVPFG